MNESSKVEEFHGFSIYAHKINDRWHVRTDIVNNMKHGSFGDPGESLGTVLKMVEDEILDWISESKEDKTKGIAMHGCTAIEYPSDCKLKEGCSECNYYYHLGGMQIKEPALEIKEDNRLDVVIELLDSVIEMMPEPRVFTEPGPDDQKINHTWSEERARTAGLNQQEKRILECMNEQHIGTRLLIRNLIKGNAKGKDTDPFGTFIEQLAKDVKPEPSNQVCAYYGGLDKCSYKMAKTQPDMECTDPTNQQCLLFCIRTKETEDDSASLKGNHTGHCKECKHKSGSFQDCFDSWVEEDYEAATEWLTDLSLKFFHGGRL